ncbi:hypothetical protein Y032_0545g3245 [Ancylostoma ceylanicum]|uniref:SH3 domain-containing protein n=2 Tax=Ancylostoma ceylanicum TaxID=53326 RepID=A0A016WR63_9BILA|nr:hypothetical protein Y032_0545g3245 [Ancylostoma ceylanicum]
MCAGSLEHLLPLPLLALIYVTASLRFSYKRNAMCNQRFREILLYEFKFGRFAGKATTAIKIVSPAPDGLMAGGQSHSGYEQPPPYSNGGGPFQAPPSSAMPPSHAPPPQQQKPSAKALFDFEAQSEGELNLKEGQIVELISQVDENWFEGRLNGKSGLFPVTYVQVLIPLR